MNFKKLLRNGGELAYNNLTKQWYHPERTSIEEDIDNGWNSHGFTICLENDLQVVSQAKLDDLKARTVDPLAIPCIIPIQGTSELNSAMWMDLKKRLMESSCEFLLEDIEYDLILEARKDYFDLTSEEKAIMKLPYLRTMELIHEAINLSQEWKDGKVKLKEPRSGTKDIIVALSYGNYIATLIENKLDKGDQQTSFDVNEWSFLKKM